MNCERARSLIDAYSTDELDIAGALDVEQHLQECFHCAGELESLRALRGSMPSSLRYTAPAELRRHLGGQLIDRAAPRHMARYALAAAIAALVLLPMLAIYWNTSHAATNQLAAEITSSHVRSLMGDHLLDVPSTDQHTVKPWFSGKLDFSPTVVDLTPHGFPLIGGRLEYIDSHPVAAVVYQRQKHIINLFTWPGNSADSSPSLLNHNGYNLLTWNRNGMTFVAVSDLNPQELRHFTELLQPAGPATQP